MQKLGKLLSKSLAITITIASLGYANAQSFEINSVISQTVGTSASLPDAAFGIPASGNASNTNFGQVEHK